MSPEHRAKFTFLGRHHTEETRAKLRVARRRKRKPRPPEIRAKISVGLIAFHAARRVQQAALAVGG